MFKYNNKNKAKVTNHEPESFETDEYVYLDEYVLSPELRDDNTASSSSYSNPTYNTTEIILPGAVPTQKITIGEEQLAPTSLAEKFGDDPTKRTISICLQQMNGHTKIIDFASPDETQLENSQTFLKILGVHVNGFMQVLSNLHFSISDVRLFLCDVANNKYIRAILAEDVFYNFSMLDAPNEHESRCCGIGRDSWQVLYTQYKNAIAIKQRYEINLALAKENIRILSKQLEKTNILLNKWQKSPAFFSTDDKTKQKLESLQTEHEKHTRALANANRYYDTCLASFETSSKAVDFYYKKLLTYCSTKAAFSIYANNFSKPYLLGYKSFYEFIKHNHLSVVIWRPSSQNYHPIVVHIEDNSRPITNVLVDENGARIIKPMLTTPDSKIIWLEEKTDFKNLQCHQETCTFFYSYAVYEGLLFQPLSTLPKDADSLAKFRFTNTAANQKVLIFSSISCSDTSHSCDSFYAFKFTPIDDSDLNTLLNYLVTHGVNIFSIVRQPPLKLCDLEFTHDNNTVAVLLYKDSKIPDNEFRKTVLEEVNREFSENTDGKFSFVSVGSNERTNIFELEQHETKTFCAFM